MSTVKSFTELGSIYQKQILDGKSNVITESVDKQTVGKVGDIGTPKLTKGGDEKAKKSLTTPKEGKTEDGKPEDGEKAISQSKSITESKHKKMSTSTFDRVFQQIVEDADTLETPEAPALDNTVISGDEVSEMGEGVDESPEDIVRQICELTSKLKTIYGITDDDEEDVDDTVEDIDADVGDTVEEAVAAKTLPHSAGRSLQGKKNTVGKVIPLKKKVDTKLTTGDGKPSKIGSVEKLAGNKNVKVNGTSSAVKGGNACAFSS
ncbi:MAG: hypothetical protein LC127_13915 [Chitinophagales bacterium]|nr:hypothetical protein [Chitinophagales bacterium]